MTMPDYFQPHENYFWQWEDGGAVLSITGGATIAYREYATEVLTHLSETGWPPFGSLLLSLIATNANGKGDLGDLHHFMNRLLGEANKSREPLNSSFAFLHRLAALPRQYKTGGNRLLLLQTIFTDCHNRRSAATSKLFLQQFQSTLGLGGGSLAAGKFYFNLYHEDFHVVSLLAKKFLDNETLLNALAALPLVEEEVKIEKPESADVGETNFIDALMENGKTFPVGSLVKRLWSGLNISHHNTLPSQQPLGGVSDLTNKGELHRLLISEFAADDVLLLSRLANNEALYLNREVLPQNNDRERIVLIDVSIKNWGTPRTVAYALLLAIAKHPKADIPCSAYAVGDGCKSIRFDSVDDVIEALQYLSPALHPAQGLEAFFKEHGNKKNKEVFFISSAETYRQPALHKTLSDHYSSISYWLHTDAGGGVDLYKRQQASKKHVQHLQLPLEELWTAAPKEKKEVKVEAKVKKEGGKRGYPILFPAAANPRNTMVTENGDVYIITNEWSLLRQQSRSERHTKGWEMLYEGLPHFTGMAEIGVKENGGLLLLLFNHSNKKVTLLDLQNSYSRSAHFANWDEMAFDRFVFFENAFLLSNHQALHKFWRVWLGEEVEYRSFENSSPVLQSKFTAREEARKNVYVPHFLISTVFKNIKRVFISDGGRLMLNQYEMKIVHQSWRPHNEDLVRLEKAGLWSLNIASVYGGKGKFRFPDGSVVEVNRSGMLVLRSSNPSLQTVYIPLVVDYTLGLATETDFTGYAYFNPDGEFPKEIINPKDFWAQHITPFIETIKNHGA